MIITRGVYARQRTIELTSFFFFYKYKFEYSMKKNGSMAARAFNRDQPFPPLRLRAYFLIFNRVGLHFRSTLLFTRSGQRLGRKWNPLLIRNFSFDNARFFCLNSWKKKEFKKWQCNFSKFYEDFIRRFASERQSNVRLRVRYLAFIFLFHRANVPPFD